MRSDASKSVQTWFKIACDMAQLAGVSPCLPRICSRMANRGNASTDSNDIADPIARHYAVNLYYPFLDHIICELDEQFTSKLTVTNYYI